MLAVRFERTDMNYETLRKAGWIATEAHRGQFRRDGHTPYIVHPQRVFQRLAKAYPSFSAEFFAAHHQKLHQ